MMEILVKTLASVGVIVIFIVIAYAICKLVDLFERVGRLEINDDVRRIDIIDVRDQIMRIKEKL